MLLRNTFETCYSTVFQNKTIVWSVQVILHGLNSDEICYRNLDEKIARHGSGLCYICQLMLMNWNDGFELISFSWCFKIIWSSSTPPTPIGETVN